MVSEPFHSRLSPRAERYGTCPARSGRGGFTVVQSRQGGEAGTGDGLPISSVGEARAAAALPRPRSSHQLELDALNNYPKSSFDNLDQLVILYREGGPETPFARPGGGPPGQPER
jgi:hypothetical protein